MARIGGRGYRRWLVWLAGVGGLLATASVLYAGVQLAHGGLDAVNAAGLLGLPLGVASLLVAVVGLRRPPEGDLAQLARVWASTLAEQVKEDGQRQWRQLIGDDTQRINLTFSLRPEPGRAAVVPAGAGRLFEGTPTLPDVATYYRHTCPHRLVVTGAAGAGKSVLALELMLALIEGRGETDPVPVRLSLAEWDTAIPLSAWLARHLVDVYDWPAKMAREVIRQRRVLPVLDGLDEMDPTAPDGTPSPDAPRAQAALDALNAYQNGLATGPVILTCRTRHYEAVRSRTRLLDAARIDIDHLTPSTARAYLLQRAPDPARWQLVLEALDGDPAGTLATSMSTPWRLSLAATVYAHHGDPSDLLRHANPADLDDYLLARFVPAATALHPRPRRPYTAVDVHRWMARLAAYLNTSSPAPGSPTGAGANPRTDLVLHQLWPLAGARRVRAADVVLATLAVLLPAFAWASNVPLLVPIWFAVWAGFVASRASVAVPVRLPRGGLRTTTGCRDVAFGLAFGPAAGLTLGLALGVGFGLIYGLVLGLTAGLVIGLTAGLAYGLAGTIGREPSSARPRDVIRSELLRGLAYGLAFGLSSGLGFGFAYGLGGLAFGATAGLMYGFVCVPSGRRYLVFVLCSRGKLPWRLGVFLDWACAAGMLRFSGAAYQFRHRELQQWLAHHPCPPPV
ncbi:NACHT domain-containing protein [Streptomyces avermitilis]|uniref:NACHT domain-containing protein n=1 Tax=Streptomyces avermitilis TaxID=33903 RepID=UPI0033A622FF